MCPACMAGAAWMIASVVSTGGLTALVVKKLGAKNGAKSGIKKSFQKQNPKEETWAK